MRPHPAETIVVTSPSYSDLVRSEFDEDATDNVAVKTPEDDVNWFVVTGKSDTGGINTSTVGIELLIDTKICRPVFKHT